VYFFIVQKCTVHSKCYYENEKQKDNIDILHKLANCFPEHEEETCVLIRNIWYMTGRSKCENRKIE